MKELIVVNLVTFFKEHVKETQSITTSNLIYLIHTKRKEVNDDTCLGHPKDNYRVASSCIKIFR